MKRSSLVAVLVVGFFGVNVALADWIVTGSGQGTATASADFGRPVEDEPARGTEEQSIETVPNELPADDVAGDDPAPPDPESSPPEPEPSPPVPEPSPSEPEPTAPEPAPLPEESTSPDPQATSPDPEPSPS